MEMVRDDDLIRLYLPDEYLEKKVPDRQFLLNVINSLYPDYLENVI